MNNNNSPVDNSTHPKQSRLKKLLKKTELCIRLHTYAEKFGLLDKLEGVDCGELLQSIFDLL